MVSSRLLHFTLFSALLLQACSTASTGRPPQAFPPPQAKRPAKLAAIDSKSWERRPTIPSDDPSRPQYDMREFAVAPHDDVPPPEGSVEEDLAVIEDEPPSDDSADVIAAIPPSESLLSDIDASTPPGRAAALRQIDQGRKLIEQNDYDRAVEHLERGVSIDPSTAEGYYYLGRVNLLRGNYSQALAFTSRALSLARSDNTWTGRAYTLQAEIYEEAGRYPDARASYARALRADPGNLSARVGAARLQLPQDEIPD